MKLRMEIRDPSDPEHVRTPYCDGCEEPAEGIGYAELHHLEQEVIVCQYCLMESLAKMSSPRYCPAWFVFALSEFQLQATEAWPDFWKLLRNPR